MCVLRSFFGRKQWIELKNTLDETRNAMGSLKNSLDALDPQNTHKNEGFWSFLMPCPAC